MFLAIFNYLWALIGSIVNSIVLPKPLSKDEEAELLASFFNGNRSARNALIEHNLRLIPFIGKKFKNSGIDSDDIISIGSIGLINGIDTYKKSSNTRLSAYLTRCIENEFLMYLRKNKKIKNNISLDENIGADGDGREYSLIDTIKDENSDVFEETNKRISISNMLESIDNTLDMRERKIIIMRYGLDGKKPLTQARVARALGISRAYVSRIESEAVKKLRAAQN